MLKNKSRNQMPYLLLFIIHTAILLWTFSKRGNKKALLLLLAGNVGLGYLFEYFVFNVFRAYQYMPKFFKDKHLDNAAGAILSQGIYVPFTALFLTVNKFSGKAKWAAAFYFYLVEKCFIKLKIYKAKWWRPLYTLFLIPIYFSLSDILYREIKKRQKAILNIVHFFIIDVWTANLFYMLAALKKIRFGRGKYYSWDEHFLITPIYVMLISFSLLLSQRRGVNWGKAAVVLGMTQLAEQMLRNLHLFKVRYRTVKVRIFIQIYMYFVTICSSYLIHRSKKNQCGGNIMKKKQSNEENLKRRQTEVMEISATGYGYEFHAVDETAKMKNRRNK